MTDCVVIIHGSVIVQQGLTSILQRYFNLSVKSFATFHDFLSSGKKFNGTALIITGQEISMQPDFKNFLAEQPGIASLVILNQHPAGEQEPGFHFICLDYSQTEIRDRIESAIGILNEEKTPSELTDREIEVLKLLAMGNSNKEIAAKLFISTHTVISHRKNISEKLSIRSASGLTVYAVLNNSIDTSNLDIGDLI